MEVLKTHYMKKFKRLKIFSLALYHLFMPEVIKHKFYFKTSPHENLAIGLVMTKIKYWRHFIWKRKPEKKIIYFIKEGAYSNYNN